MAAWMRLLRPLLPAPALPQIPDREASVRVGPVSQLELRQRHNALRALAATFAAHACACMSVPGRLHCDQVNECLHASLDWARKTVIEPAGLPQTRVAVHKAAWPRPLRSVVAIAACPCVAPDP